MCGAEMSSMCCHLRSMFDCSLPAAPSSKSASGSNIDCRWLTAAQSLLLAKPVLPSRTNTASAGVRSGQAAASHVAGRLRPMSSTPHDSTPRTDSTPTAHTFLRQRRGSSATYTYCTYLPIEKEEEPPSIFRSFPFPTLRERALCPDVHSSCGTARPRTPGGTATRGGTATSGTGPPRPRGKLLERRWRVNRLLQSGVCRCCACRVGFLSHLCAVSAVVLSVVLSRSIYAT